MLQSGGMENGVGKKIHWMAGLTGLWLTDCTLPGDW